MLGVGEPDPPRGRRNAAGDPLRSPAARIDTERPEPAVERLADEKSVSAADVEPAGTVPDLGAHEVHPVTPRGVEVLVAVLREAAVLAPEVPGAVALLENGRGERVAVGRSGFHRARGNSSGGAGGLQ